MSDSGPERSSQPPPGDGRPVGFEMTSGQGRVVLTLEDGAVLHVHPIVVDVRRSDRKDERGDPIYVIQGGIAVRVMKKPTDEETNT